MCITCVAYIYQISCVSCLPRTRVLSMYPVCPVFTYYLYITCIVCLGIKISTYHIHHFQIVGQYIVFCLMYQIFKKRKPRKKLYVMYKSEEAAKYRLFLLEKLKRHFKNAAYIYLKGFTSSKRLSNESFNVIIL